MGILLKNGLIITQNSSREIFTANILVEDDRISAVEPHIPEDHHQIINLENQVIAPGFIQSHVHLCQTLFRNLSDDLELMDWLENYIWPLENAHNQDSLNISAQLGLAELMLGGTTTILDMGNGRLQEVIFQAMEQSGMRGLSGIVMMDRGDHGYKQDTGEILALTEKYITEWHYSRSGRIGYALAPRFVPSCSMELWSGVGELARKYGLIIHTHSSENRKEWQLVKELTGYSNIEFFVKEGLASQHLCLAHCIWVSEEETEMLSDFGIHVLHCPSANLKLGSGIAPIPEFSEKGINISLGSDGAACNNNLDMFQEMRLAALIQKPRTGVTSTTARMVYDMATLGGARALGLENQIGSIEPGKKADLIILDLNKVHSIPADDIYSQIVYSARSSDVSDVMIDGKWVVKNRTVQTLDVDSLKTDAWQEISRLYKRQQHV